MGKVSVYKFNISDSNEQMRAEQIIQQYLVDKNFIYDDKYNCYRVTQQNYTNSIDVRYGLEYRFENNQLVINAFTINEILNIKQSINGTSFVPYIKELIKLLEQNGFMYLGKGKSNSDDNSAFKRLMVILVCVLLIAILFFIAMYA
ncbi:MAG: hypothetical protein IKN87_02475 [Bacilli bacterium]|nr:hypothetical protein [Bacilli bacterium]